MGTASLWAYVAISASVSLIGTNAVPTNWNVYVEYATLGATGAQGPQGATGAVGPTGPTGPAGSSNPIDDYVIDYSKRYLTFEVLTAGTITIIADNSSVEGKTISYSTDNGTTWNNLITSTTEQSFGTFGIGDTLLLKGNNTSISVKYYSTKINGTAQTKVSGNIMSLLYGDDFKDKVTFPNKTNCNFEKLFYNYTNLKDASDLILPATTLTDNCYHYMFYGCTSLVKAPELPATILVINSSTLAANCYSSMFSGCTSLVKAPELPATKLPYGCYSSMFSDCTSLVKAPELPATILADSCYNGMFYGCTSLVKAPELPATILADYCYGGMFGGCISLTKAPELPATTLANYCYIGMFSGCSKLNYIKALFTTTPSNTYTKDWVTNVASTGTFIKSNLATWTTIGTNAVPTNWNIYVENATQTPTGIVTSTTNGLKIEVVSSMPATGINANTIYIVQAQ